jgi:hypothetical protein
MRFTISFIAFVTLLISVGCKNEPKKAEEVTSDTSHESIQVIDNPTTGNASLPRLFATNEALYMSWVERKDSMAILKYSIFDQETWSSPMHVNSGNDWFVNWADFPAIAVNNGVVLTNILQKSASGTYTYDIKLNLNTPLTISEALPQNFILHNDGTQSEHGFVSMLPWNDDSFFVTWLDGRNTSGSHDATEMNSGGAMTLRSAEVSTSGVITNRTELDARVCDCCKTSAAMTPSGPVVVYRDRDENEVRDISLVRWQQDIGWSDPISIGNDHWKINGCPVNGPSIDAFDTTLVTTWFTAARGEGEVEVAFSIDGGISFGKTYRVDAGNATGRVDAVMLSLTEAAILWMEPHGDEEFIQLMKIDVNGVKQPAITIAKTSEDRASGFPQLEMLDDTLYVAWTSILENGETIKTVSLSIQDLY